MSWLVRLGGTADRRVMAFSAFDRRLLEEGLAFFSRPRLASLLEVLGATRVERVEVLATMLGNSSPEEFDEAVAIFERAVERATRAQARAEDRDRVRRRTEQRRESAAERREQRRRST